MGWGFGLLVDKVLIYSIVTDAMALWVVRGGAELSHCHRFDGALGCREGAELFQCQRFGWSFGLLDKVRSYSIVKDGMGLWLAG